MRSERERKRKRMGTESCRFAEIMGRNGDFPTVALIQEHQYDAVIMEGTTGLNEQYGGHMCLMNNIRIRDRLKENKCLRENSRFLLTHLSPHWCPPHDWYESIVASEGLELAYDGLQIEV